MSNLNENISIITEKTSFGMIGLYRWIAEDNIDSRQFKERTLTEFINKAVENELTRRNIDLKPRNGNGKFEDWGWE